MAGIRMGSDMTFPLQQQGDLVSTDLLKTFAVLACIVRGSYRIYSLGGGGGGGELKTFGIYVMGVHKQAPSRGVWGLPPPNFFWQNRCSQIDSDTVASCHRIYTIIIREANHRIIAHGQNILVYDTIASCHRIYTIIIRKANHRIIAHGQNILDYDT